MSGISVAMSGIRAATARLEASAENLANQYSRGALPQPRADAAPPLQPHTTPIPKVYRPMRANLHSLANSTGDAGGVGVQYQQTATGYYVAYDPAAPYADDQGRVAAPAVDASTELLEQVQAAAHYRASLKALEGAQQMQDTALNIIA